MTANPEEDQNVKINNLEEKILGLRETVEKQSKRLGTQRASLDDAAETVNDLSVAAGIEPKQGKTYSKEYGADARKEAASLEQNTGSGSEVKRLNNQRAAINKIYTNSLEDLREADKRDLAELEISYVELRKEFEQYKKHTREYIAGSEAENNRLKQSGVIGKVGILLENMVKTFGHYFGKDSRHYTRQSVQAEANERAGVRVKTTPDYRDIEIELPTENDDHSSLDKYLNHMAAAQSRWDAGQYSFAIPYLTAAARFQNTPEVRVKLGFAFEDANDDDAALNHYSSAINLARTEGDTNIESLAMYNRGKIHHKRGELDEAEKFITAANKIEPREGTKRALDAIEKRRYMNSTA